jgi:uncharacterized membrane protein
MRKTNIIIFLFLISLFPISTKAQAPVSPEGRQAVTEEEVNRFFDEYKARYMKMDIDAFMDLFSNEAVENRTIPYADIREGYRKTFDNSRSIQYSLEIYSIQTYQKSAFVRGRYELIQSLKGSKKKRVFQGDIQWELIRENGSLKIKEINYGRDR